jgi:hypothetical protein
VGWFTELKRCLFAARDSRDGWTRAGQELVGLRLLYATTSTIRTGLIATNIAFFFTNTTIPTTAIPLLVLLLLHTINIKSK